MPSVSGLSGYFFSITWSSSCFEWCIPLPMWIYSQGSVWMCGSACVGQQAMVYLQQILNLWFCQVWVDSCALTWGTRVSSICGPNRCLRTQLQDWESWMAVQGRRLIAGVWCWSHASWSKAIYVDMLAELCWKFSVLWISTRVCKSYLNSWFLSFLKDGYLPRLC